MYIEEILKILSPPDKPLDAPHVGEWIAAEEKLEHSFPSDYKEFVEKFGEGKIDNFLHIFTPFSKNENFNLIMQRDVQSKVLKELKSYDETIPYPILPEPGGLLPFAATDNGDVLFWKTSGIADKWTIVVNAARSPDWKEYDMSMAEFLLQLLRRRLHCEIFPVSFPSPSPMFEPV
ncbi:SMI1/KNR4 family protein [Undibacterium hunanense]|nr:SMI1/KNR4 family protein [Undibacterium hunanense]